jgi:hypothetical protein
LLLDASATVAGVGRYPATPLRVAASDGYADVVESRVGAGALTTDPPGGRACWRMSTPLTPASIIDVVIVDLGDEWEERTSRSVEAALAFAARLRDDPDPASHASWHVVAASRDELAIVRSALVETAYGTTRALLDGVDRLVIQDLIDRQIAAGLSY